MTSTEKSSAVAYFSQKYGGSPPAQSEDHFENESNLLQFLIRVRLKAHVVLEALKLGIPQSEIL